MKKKIILLALFLIPFLIFTLLIHMGLASNERLCGHPWDHFSYKSSPSHSNDQFVLVSINSIKHFTIEKPSSLLNFEKKSHFTL